MLFKLLLLIVFLVHLTACTYKTLYNNLDTMMMSYVQGMVTLDEAQEDTLDKRTRAILQWHRTTQLQAYADWLQTVQGDINAQLTEEVVLHRISEEEKLLDILFARLNSEIAQLLPLLDEEQQLELFDNITDKNEDFREKYVDLTKKERWEKVYDSLTENYEDWLGTLTQGQEQFIKQASTKMENTAELRLNQRLRWQQGIRQIMQEFGNRKNTAIRLQQYFNNHALQHDKLMQDRMKTNKRVIAQITVQLAKTITAEQRRHFILKTNDYIHMFREWATNS